MSKLRVVYHAGSGNAFRTLADWRDGGRGESFSHVTYSSQFYEAVHTFGGEARVLCSAQGESDVSGRGITVCYRPDRFASRRGPSYYLAHLETAADLRHAAATLDANVVVFTEATLPACVASLGRSGVALVQSLHCRLWTGAAPKLKTRMLLETSKPFYRRQAAAILTVSPQVARDVVSLAGPRCRPIVPFRASYRPEHFGDLARPDLGSEQLAAIYIGRLEEDKGVMDIVEIASRLKSAGIPVRFDICGDGGARQPLEESVAEQGLGDLIRVHGWCDRPLLRRILATCHVGLAPTRSSFAEGFNKAVIEAILAHRPVLVSSACPDTQDLHPAVEILPADTISPYVEALARLARDRGELARRVAACSAAGKPFLDGAHSFQSALESVFEAVLEGRDVAPRTIYPTFANGFSLPER